MKVTTLIHPDHRVDPLRQNNAGTSFSFSFHGIHIHGALRPQKPYEIGDLGIVG